MVRNRTNTYVSEVELILELSGRYIEGGQSNANDTLSNTGLKHDWGQGHGLIDTKYAVQMALTLESLRNADEDGILDNEMVTVFDARDAMLEYPTSISLENLQIRLKPIGRENGPILLEVKAHM